MSLSIERNISVMVLKLQQLLMALFFDIFFYLRPIGLLLLLDDGTYFCFLLNGLYNFMWKSVFLTLVTPFHKYLVINTQPVILSYKINFKFKFFALFIEFLTKLQMAPLKCRFLGKDLQIEQWDEIG